MTKFPLLIDFQCYHCNNETEVYDNSDKIQV